MLTSLTSALSPVSGVAGPVNASARGRATAADRGAPRAGPRQDQYRVRMGILSWIVLGLLAGGIAKLLMPGKDPGGCIVTVLLGVGGALLGGWLGRTLFDTDLGTFYDLRTWGLAVAGAVVILLIYRLVFARSGD